MSCQVNKSFISQTQKIIVDQSNNFFVGVCVGGAAGGFWWNAATSSSAITSDESRAQLQRTDNSDSVNTEIVQTD